MKKSIFKVFIMFFALIIHTFGVISSISYAATNLNSNIFHGIDVSEYQREIDYSRVREARYSGCLY